jgi:hypothetical protein
MIETYVKSRLYNEQLYLDLFDDRLAPKGQEMNNLDAVISELFREQTSVRSEVDYRSQVNQAASQLFDRQPPGTALPMKAFQAIVVSLLADYRLSLEDVRKRITKSASG